MQIWGHPAVESTAGPARPGWLLLASDGAYEAHEDAGGDLAAYLTGAPKDAAAHLVDDAIGHLHEPYVDNATALVVHLTDPQADTP
ncbi:hypothetical protein [Streptomyces sp. NPDC048659]|uniref:hypothetical protein n=1 Tax=Streptomyces sp. NPDC048659 TaxID=3155489 RepID=UPI00341588B1